MKAFLHFKARFQKPRCSSGESAPVMTRWKPCTANSSRQRRTNSAEVVAPSATGTKKATEPSARHGPIRALSLPQRTILPKRWHRHLGGVCGHRKGSGRPFTALEA